MQPLRTLLAAAVKLHLLPRAGLLRAFKLHLPLRAELLRELKPAAQGQQVQPEVLVQLILVRSSRPTGRTPYNVGQTM